MDALIADWPGKSALEGVAHPAAYHMLDVAAVAELLLDGQMADGALGEALVLLTALHDLGKIGAPFRAMLLSGAPQEARHWEVTEILLHHHDGLLETLGPSRVRKALYASVAGHHGSPPALTAIVHPRGPRLIGAEALRDSAALITAFRALWPQASLAGLDLAAARRLGWWLPGLIAAADWIGSNPAWFPPVAPGPSLAEYLHLARGRARRAVDEAGVIPPARPVPARWSISRCAPCSRPAPRRPCPAAPCWP